MAKYRKWNSGFEAVRFRASGGLLASRNNSHVSLKVLRQMDCHHPFGYVKAHDYWPYKRKMGITEETLLECLLSPL